MPAIPASITLLSTLVDRDINTTAAAAVAPADPLQVVCAWPVSGQYGPGSRYLYEPLHLHSIFPPTRQEIPSHSMILVPSILHSLLIILQILRPSASMSPCPESGLAQESMPSCSADLASGCCHTRHRVGHLTYRWYVSASSTNNSTQLTFSPRRSGYGPLRSIPAMLNRHSGSTSHSQAVINILQ